MASGQLPHSTYSKAAGSPGPQDRGTLGKAPGFGRGRSRCLAGFCHSYVLSSKGKWARSSCQLEGHSARGQWVLAGGWGPGGVPGPAASSTGMTPALLRAVVAALESLSGSGSYLLLVSEGRARVVLSREGVIAASWGGL